MMHCTFKIPEDIKPILFTKIKASVSVQVNLKGLNVDTQRFY